MNRDVKLIVSIGDICLAYGCVALVTCAIGCAAYNIGRIKAKLEIVDILNECLSGTKVEAK